MPLDPRIAEYFKTAQGKLKFAQAVETSARKLLNDTTVRKILQVVDAPDETLELAMMHVNKDDYYVDVGHNIVKVRRTANNFLLPKFELSHNVSITLSRIRLSDDSKVLLDLNKTFAREISKLELELFEKIIEDLYETSSECYITSADDVKNFQYIFCHSYDDISSHIKLPNHFILDCIQPGTILAVNNLTGYLGDVAKLTVLPSDNPGSYDEDGGQYLGPSIGFTCFEQISMLVKRSKIECIKFVDESKFMNKFKLMQS